MTIYGGQGVAVRRPPAAEKGRTKGIKRPRMSVAMRSAERRLGFVAVCLIGYEGRVPRYMGDNLGAWPVRIATSTKPRDVTKKPDLESPIHKVVVLDYAYCPTDKHAARLKKALDELLLGSSAENRKLRHGWRDVEDPAVVWPIILAEAIRGLEEEAARRRSSSPRFDVFDERERMRRLEAEVKRVG